MLEILPRWAIDSAMGVLRFTLGNNNYSNI